MKIKKLVLVLLYLTFFQNPINAQLSEKEFEKKYLEFHDKWDAGYDPSIKDVELFFKDCPDLNKFPHYFIYIGELLSDKGYLDLGLKYYLIYEKLLNKGYERKQINDHKPIIWFKIGTSYSYLYNKEKTLEYITKSKNYLKDNYSFQTYYDLTELETNYIFYFTENKEKAINMLEDLYKEAGQHKESITYKIRNTARLRAINFAIYSKNLDRAKKILYELKSDPWTKSLSGSYLRWYYKCYRDYYIEKKQYDLVIKYNDSITRTPPIAIEDKEYLYESNIKAYSNINKDSLVDVYKDSLNYLLKKQRGVRLKSSVIQTEENEKYQKILSKLSSQNRKQKLYWFLVTAILIVLLVLLLFIYKKRKAKSEKELIKEKNKVELLNSNYQQLLKNYQFTTKQLEKIKHTLAVEIQKNKSSDLIKIHKNISNNIDKNHNEKLLSINKLRDQFILNLRERFPELTNYESLICFYTKMNLTAKEISEITNLTVRSVQSHQYRISQKTKKKFDTKLKDFLKEVPLSIF